jgi:hypothetical protein
MENRKCADIPIENKHGLRSAKYYRTKALPAGPDYAVSSRLKGIKPATGSDLKM